MQHKGVDRFRAREIMNAGENSARRSVKRQAPAPDPGRPVLPPEYEPLVPGPRGWGGLALAVFEYVRRRGITDAQVSRHRLGFCVTGPYYGRLIVPVTRDGQVAYFVARSVRCAGPRYLNPPRSSLGVGKSEVIFGFDQAMADGAGEVIVTEGVFDALAVPRGVAILGKQLSDWQLWRLRSARRVGVMLDADAADEQARIVTVLNHSGVDAYPLHVRGKDPSSAAGAAAASEWSFVDHVMALTRMRR